MHRPVPEDRRIEAETRRWIERVVLGLELCPFARPGIDAGRLRVAISAARVVPALVADLDVELARLMREPVARLESTLLVAPRVAGLERFEDFNDAQDVVEALLRERGAEGVVQVVGFHPQFRFADTHAGIAGEDAADYANRSPHPMLHLLREESVAIALASHPAPERIAAHNAQRLRALGAPALRALLAGCRDGAAAEPASEGARNP